ncbi:hypothetical protein ACJMK2_034361 [Sinanodonta woodiana]|uniref:SAP domain-containing protein n=1 Tax=Sinanodonta woodiana TaxID=1069815 RepID=A0ABD3WRA5_SINWO
MGPVRNKRVSYDPELLENWTIGRLKEELTVLNIHFPSNARRMHLVRLVREARSRTVPQGMQSSGSTSHEDASARSHDATSNVNIHGRQQSDSEKALTDIVSGLTNTVQSLQQNVIALTNKVNTMSSSAHSSATVNSAVQVRPGNPFADDVDTAQNFTLDTGYKAFHSPSAAAGSEEQARHSSFVRTPRGYSAESLPFVETVSPQLRKNIVAGRDINLAALLIPYYTGSGVIESFDAEGVKSGKPDPRINRALSLGEFIQAFGIYKNIMCNAFPRRRQELDLYERDIVEMATRYQGNGFYEYHKKFSLDAAAHLRYNNIVVDWSIRNNTLFCNIFANSKPNACSGCGSTFHGSEFCNQRSLNIYHKETIDAYGRERVLYLGKEICNNFNGTKGCVALQLCDAGIFTFV